jgi:hypothetical protein
MNSGTLFFSHSKGKPGCQPDLMEPFTTRNDSPKHFRSRIIRDVIPQALYIHGEIAYCGKRENRVILNTIFGLVKKKIFRLKSFHPFSKYR